MSDDSDTLTEIDRLTEALRNGVLRGDELRQWLAKVRAHAVADELERKRLQAEILRSAVYDGKRLYDEERVRYMLRLELGWETAPQGAREAARAMRVGGGEDAAAAKRAAWKRHLIEQGHCMADDDGHCVWEGCPQTRDGEPKATGRHCPRDAAMRDRYEAEE